MNELELTGRTRSHIITLNEPHCALHYEVVTSFLAMRTAAAAEGIVLTACSSFRDFDSQLHIWNRKWRGERPLLDRHGHALDYNALSAAQRLDAILCWSALPGGSRHHWGSDIDVIDTAAIPAGYQVQLIPQEYAATGIFTRLHTWLTLHSERFGFYQPYLNDQGGVSPEPWHLSYAPVSVPALESLTLGALQHAIVDSAIEGKQHVLSRLPEIYTRYLLAVDAP